MSLAQSTSADVPAAPTKLGVAAGNAQLGLTWTAPSGTVTGYDVHYTSAAASSVTNHGGGYRANNAGTAWVAVTRTGATASQTISSLTNNTSYRVRVRAKNSLGNSAWVFGTGTPAAPTAGTPAAPTGLRVTPGDIQLSVTWTAPSGTLTRLRPALHLVHHRYGHGGGLGQRRVGGLGGGQLSNPAPRILQKVSAV